MHLCDNLMGKDVSLSNLSCQPKGHIFVLINNAHTLDVLHSCVNAHVEVRGRTE